MRALLMTLCAATLAVAQPIVVDFETAPSQFVPPPEKQAMVVSTAQAHNGTSSFYSGPPANLACSWWQMGEPRRGTVEIWFYDDMVPTKRQTVALALDPSEESLMFVCAGGEFYQSRIGPTYSNTTVRRSEGWRRINFEVDAGGARLSIDGQLVRENPVLRTANRIMLGSPWDASTGWYDDLTVDLQPLSPADQAAEEAEIAAAEERRVGALLAAAPLLQTEWRPVAHVPQLPATPLAREYYQRLLRYVRYFTPQMKDVPGRPGWRFHKIDHSQEHAVRQNATTALCFATLLFDESAYDAAVTGISADDLRAEAVALVRYLTMTHVANGWATGDGRSWGDHWQSALWARSVGHAAWLLWPHLPPEVQVATAKMVTYEADRFLTRPPDSGYVSDTKAEENAWNSQIMVLAGCVFPNHPRAAEWRERAIVYQMNSFVRTADLESDAIVDGRPARDRLSAVTLHDDYSLENHDRVHPDYLGCIYLLLDNALLYDATGQPLPDATRYNVSQCWRLAQWMYSSNGSAYYLNGQDWWPHRHDTPLGVAGTYAVLYGDPDAARVTRGALAATARLHARFDNGRMWAPQEFNYPNAEEELAVRYAHQYLLQRLRGDGPAPTDLNEWRAARRGVLVSEPAGYFLQRLSDRTVSFSWRNGAMGLVWPLADDDTWFTAPSERGLVGRISVAGETDGRPVVTNSFVATRNDREVGVSVTIERCGGAVRQEVALVSVPGAPVLYLERLVATRDLTLDSVATGWLPIFNEPLPVSPPNERRLVTAAGEQQITGAQQAPDTWLAGLGTWANVDQRYGAVVVGGSMGYWDNNTWRGSRLEEALVANYRPDSADYTAGQVISQVAVAVLPSGTAEQTAAGVEQLTWIDDGPDALAARWGGLTVRAAPGAVSWEGQP